ncbi:hypothetical protein PO909_017635 [Leuciscus waleckii]
MRPQTMNTCGLRSAQQGPNATGRREPNTNMISSSAKPHNNSSRSPPSLIPEALALSPSLSLAPGLKRNPRMDEDDDDEEDDEDNDEDDEEDGGMQVCSRDEKTRILNEEEDVY